MQVLCIILYSVVGNAAQTDHLYEKYIEGEHSIVSINLEAYEAAF